MRNLPRLRTLGSLFVAGLFAAACAAPAAGPSSPSSGGGRAGGTTPSAPQRSTTKLDPAQVERLKRVMIPLVQVADNQRGPGQVKVAVVDDDHINAGSAGEGQYLVTTGLLRKANDQQLAGVLAHEVAHDDLGHVAKAQRLNTGLAIGMVILDQIIPGSGNITPIAGTLISRAYGRQEEYQADAHGAVLLKRAGYSPKVMEDTLTWLLNTEGGGEGGFFSTHPATDDRIAALRRNTVQ
ncbi:MAG TPA: M48 family metallopeptidase [Methylomirabilota bacterium]|nr:M48 family metallopeptidase [Methylomirabilota bacterium]